MSAAKVELGRHLFYDKRMSVNSRTVMRQWSPAGTGVHRRTRSLGRDNGPTASPQQHEPAGRRICSGAHLILDSLEEQAVVSMLGESPVELGMEGHEEVFVDVARKDPVYQKVFVAVFSAESDPSRTRITKALARV